MVFDRVPKSQCSAAVLGDFRGTDRRRIAEKVKEMVPTFVFGLRTAARDLVVEGLRRLHNGEAELTFPLQITACWKACAWEKSSSQSCSNQPASWLSRS